MDVMNLRWREAVQLKSRILRAQRAQQIFVPLDAKIRMQTALHQHARAAKRDRLVDLLANLVERADVSIRRTGPTIERAERADDVADVCVVDVAIDDVGDDVVGMAARAYLVGCSANARDVVRLEEERAFVNAHALTGKHAIENWLNVRHLNKPQRLHAFDELMFVSEFKIEPQPFFHRLI